MAPRSSATETSSGGDDERLLIEAAKADPQRFADLYAQNFDRVYAFVVRRSGSRGEAEDLTAEVFHQAWPISVTSNDAVCRSRPGSSRSPGTRSPMFYLYVDDVDTWYRRAVAAGLSQTRAPAQNS
jgi:uncharacterized glyoxalase superfamily protein PhnB